MSKKVKAQYRQMFKGNTIEVGAMVIEPVVGRSCTCPAVIEAGGLGGGPMPECHSLSVISGFGVGRCPHLGKVLGGPSNLIIVCNA